MNNVTIMGRLGSEPVVRNTNGSTVARLSLGVTINSEKNSDKSTEWIDVYLRDSLALIAQQYYHTGDKIYLVYCHSIILFYYFSLSSALRFLLAVFTLLLSSATICVA